MFLKEIEEFNRVFKLLNNVNVLLFSAWNDAASEAYKNGELMLIESTYRTYINDMTEMSNELMRLQQDIDELVEKIKKGQEEIRQISYNPKIQGCSLHRAIGEIIPDDPNDEPTEAHQLFVTQFQEDPQRFAYTRTNLDVIQGVEYVNSL